MTTEIDLRGLNVLLVDDDEDCRDFLAAALEYEGMNVTQVSSAEQAVEAMKTTEFSVVTTDKNLPGMDGISLIKYIRENVGDVPVILITGYGTIGSAVDALKVGAQDYLLKPLEEGDDLVSAIWKAVERHWIGQENKALQERLVRAQRMESLGILAGGVAHNLNNILGPVVALPPVIMAQLDEMAEAPEAGLQGIKEDIKILEESSRRVEQIKEELRLMEKSGEKAAILVQDLLSLSVSGTYERKPVDINTVVRNFLKSPGFVDMRSAKDEMTVVTHLSDDISQILGSESHLNRILNVLAENALETMAKKDREKHPEPDVITISTSNVHLEKELIGYEVISPGDYVVVKMADSGLGIPEGQKERIFEPFFTTKAMSSSGGMGLGLSIVRGVVKDHEGFVDVQTDVGKGSTFILYFPAVASVVRQPEKEAPLPRGKEHILVVDDEPAQRYVSKRLLNELGYKVTLAENGHEAVRLVEETKGAGKEKPFDLVMLDMIMEEGFDGLATYESLSALCPSLKVVVASGYAATGRGKEMISRGAAWLAKPFGMKELAKVLRQELDARK